ncbi:hypothetical protein SprV_0802585300 [Sparganum proliferum]
MTKPWASPWQLAGQSANATASSTVKFWAKSSNLSLTGRVKILTALKFPQTPSWTQTMEDDDDDDDEEEEEEEEEEEIYH